MVSKSQADNLFICLKKYIADHPINSILFLNHYPNEKEKQDGYFNRVLYIDQIFTSYLKLYINESVDNVEPSITKICDGTFQLNISSKFENSNLLVKTLVVMFPNVYAHSIYQLFSELKKNIFLSATKAIWDVHGVVPEEEQLKGASLDTISWLQIIEEFAYSNATIIVTVTNALHNYLKQKYNALNLKKEFLTLPIISVNVDSVNIQKEYTSAKPVVVYSGGTQVWQQVDKMLHFVHEYENLFSFIFLISDPEEVKALYRKYFNQHEFPGLIKSVSINEVERYYSKAHYGLILRDDSVINSVACPTKLIEYLASGLIPIVDSATVGDFNEYGYNYIYYRDTKVLNEVDFYECINNNIRVLAKIKTLSSNSAVTLHKSTQVFTDLEMDEEIYVILINKLYSIILELSNWNALNNRNGFFYKIVNIFKFLKLSVKK